MNGHTLNLVWQVVKSAVDIVLVAYIFYFVYKLFEDTNSITIIKGFLFVVIVYAVANFVGLKTVAWIFQYVVSYFVILIVVLFQPELRKVLIRIGQSGIAGIGGNVTMETLNEIGEAVLALHERKMGGLVIIERKVGLRQLLEESVLLDADVKSEILESIFYKGSKLHDGAVLIQGKKIVAAGVMIPSIRLETVQKQKRGLGTRHRAGIAVTNESDAVSVIVSEETGAISIAQRGKLEEDLPADKFMRRLNEIFRGE